MIDYNDESYLYHYGVLGMKWGVRKDKSIKTIKNRNTKSNFSVETKNKERLNLEVDSTSHISKFISKFSKKVADNIERTSLYTIKKGKDKVGNLQLYKVSPEELNVVWIDINKKFKGNGYATAVIDGIISNAKKDSYKYITLEVPGKSPDAKHIYEKAGFKYVETLSTPDDDFVWGGLTAMRKKL